MRRIRYHDAETDKILIFLTNHFFLPALIIAQLYKCRWQVELFFKWIKQHLRIKKFYGLSPNAVKTQIWIAISVYVLLAIVRKRLRLELNLYPNVTNSQPLAFRKNATFTGFFANKPFRRNRDTLQSTQSVRLMTGQLSQLATGY